MTDKRTEKKDNSIRQGDTKAPQKIMERVIFWLYGLYHICVLFSAVAYDDAWSTSETIFIVGLCALSFMIYASKPFDFHARVSLYSILVFSNITFFSFHAGSYDAALIQFVVIVILLGLCGFEDYSRISLGFLVILMCGHAFWVKSIDLSSWEEVYHAGILYANVLIAIAVVHFWVKKRNESGQRLGKVIGDLKNAEASKDDFMANVSHEIRTPINTISGMSDILMYETDPERMHEEIHAIQVAGHSLMGVVSDILDFSELQAGQVDLVEETYDISSAINDVINSSRPLYEKSGLEFVVDIDQNLPRTLMGDSRKIRRIIMNLLSNAFKFTKEGGVCLSVSGRKESYGINLVISVTDTGIGMDESSVENLFATYNQVDASRTRREGGVGLGLAISNVLTSAMGGVITTKSKLGKGTTMQVTIPQRVIDERPIIHLDNPESYGILIYQGKEKIKMTEMRDAYGVMVGHMITQFGVKAHFCSNLAELKRRLERENYTHVFIAMGEYQEDPQFFDQLAKEITVTMVTEPEEYLRLEKSDLLYINKPLYALPVMTVLNGSKNNRLINREIRTKGFIAPEVDILVVDDNYMNIKVMEGLLKKYQIHVTQALSGYEALNKIYDVKYDIIFMDHMMPEMDGVETLKNIRSKGDNFCTKVPIVAVTANAIAGAREMLLGAGFNDFLEKPVEVTELEHLLLRMLPEEKIIYVSAEDSGKKATAVQVEHKTEVPETKPDQMVVLHQFIPEQQETSTETVDEAIAPETTDELVIGDLDVKMGMSFCGGEEAYLMILEEYAQKGERNWEDIVHQFEAQDWKNYTITVHGIKSSMKTIGAMPLSELALALELKGKEGDYDYILANHAQMLEEYKRVVAEILAYPAFAKYAVTSETEELLPQIDDALFAEKVQEFENAMFELDGDQMIAILEELAAYSYGGTNLAKALQSVKHKVEMCDYMSASEALAQEKSRLMK